MNYNQDLIIGLIKTSDLLTIQQKNDLIQTILEDNDLDDEFLDQLEQFLQKESTLAEQREQEIIIKLNNIEQVIKEEKLKINNKKKQIAKEHNQIVAQIVTKFDQDAKKLSADLDTKIESIIHQEHEQSEIDNIRNKLLNK